MINDSTDEVTKKRFQSVLSRYYSGLKTLMRGDGFILDCVLLLYQKCHKTNFKIIRTCMDSPAKKAKNNHSNNNSNK